MSDNDEGSPSLSHCRHDEEGLTLATVLFRFSQIEHVSARFGFSCGLTTSELTKIERAIARFG